MSEVTVYILLASGFSILLLWLMRPGSAFLESTRSPHRSVDLESLCRSIIVSFRKSARPSPNADHAVFA